MTLFEYLAIAFSLVLSFSAMRLVGGLPQATRVGNRYWVHLVFVIVLLLNVMNAFWAYWSFHDVVWTYPKFLLALANPAVLYFMSVSLIPENPETVASWREHYYGVRTRFFFAWGFWALLISWSSFLLVGLPLWHPLRLGHVASLVAAVIGFCSARPRIHAVLAVAASVAVLILMFSAFAQPAPLSH